MSQTSVFVSPTAQNPLFVPWDGLLGGMNVGLTEFFSQSQSYHLNNPYWKTFDPYVKPLLEGEMDLRRFEELDTSKDVVVE